MTDTTDTDYEPETGDATQPPSHLRDDEQETEQETANWRCVECGTPVADAEELANHDCTPPQSQED